MNNKTKGFFWGALSAASYGMTPLFAKPLYAAGMSVDTVLFYRYTFAAMMLAFLVCTRRQSLKLSKSDLFPLFWMGILYCISSLFLFEGYKCMDAGITATIFFAYPVMVAVIMGAFYKEHMSKMAWGCLVVAMWGIWLLGKTKGAVDINVYGVSIVLLSALAYVLYMIGVNKSRLKTMDGAKLNFYVLTLGALFFAGCLLWTDSAIALPQGGTQWGLLLLLSFVPTVVSLIALTKSIHEIGSTLTAILGAFEPITALVTGILIFHEQLTENNIIGVLMIITAVTLIVSEKQIKKLAHKMQTRKIRK